CFQGRRDGSSIGTRGISPSPSASEATDEKLHLTRVVVEHGERFLPDETMNPSDLDTFAPLVVGMQRLRQIALAAHADLSRPAGEAKLHFDALQGAWPSALLF